MSAFCWRIGNANPASAHRDDGVLLQVSCVAREQVGDQRNAPFGGHVRQTDQTTVGNIFSKNELTEIGVNGNQDTPLVGGELQQRTVSRIGAPLARFGDVMTLFPQPPRQPHPGATVDQELHSQLTRTASSESLAMTACA